MKSRCCSHHYYNIRYTSHLLYYNRGILIISSGSLKLLSKYVHKMTGTIGIYYVIVATRSDLTLIIVHKFMRFQVIQRSRSLLKVSSATLPILFFYLDDHLAFLEKVRHPYEVHEHGNVLHHPPSLHSSQSEALSADTPPAVLQTHHRMIWKKLMRKN